MTKSQIFTAAWSLARQTRTAFVSIRAAFAAALRQTYAGLKTPRSLADIVGALPQVERIAAWNDRLYVNLAAARGSRFNADIRTKIWLRGEVLTVEAGKGYASDAFTAAKDAVVSAVQAAGCSVRFA